MLLLTWFGLRQSCTELGVGSVILRGPVQSELSHEPRSAAHKANLLFVFLSQRKKDLLK